MELLQEKHLQTAAELCEASRVKAALVQCNFLLQPISCFKQHFLTPGKTSSLDEREIKCDSAT